MYRLYTLLFLLLYSVACSALEVSVSYARFQYGDQQYVEVYTHLIGSSLTYPELDSTSRQSAVNILLLFKKGDEIVQYDKYTLNGPVSEYKQDFIDLKRYVLPEGEYTLEVEVTDAHDEENKAAYAEALTLGFPRRDTIYQSDIQLLASMEQSEDDQNPFVKQGYLLEPLPFHFYHKKTSELIFYQEIYQSDQLKGNKFVVRSIIKKVAGNGSRTDVAIQNQLRNTQPIHVELSKIDISQLPSGNYELVVEVRDITNKLISVESIGFQRANPYLQLEILEEKVIEDEFVKNLSEEDLIYSLRAIAMQEQDGEILNMLLSSTGSDTARRRFLFNYWAKRDPNNPKEKYDKYMEVARAVDRTYEAGFRHGFESDRGWRFLRYGKPDDVVSIQDEPSAPPYEIWIYYEFPFTRQRNVKFLFYNPTLAPGAFELLHSTARNDLQNADWESRLYSKAPQGVSGGIDGFNVQRLAREYFSDF